MRKPVITGNWKMHKSRSEAVALARQVRRGLDGYEAAEVVVCPPFTALFPVHEALDGSSIGLGAQDVHWEPQGAFTGEISISMLLDCGCGFVIIGHSERRQFCHETNPMISHKLRALSETTLTPILCVGESLDERRQRRVEDIVLGQLEKAVEGLPEESLSRLIIAYEPVWAIGTGITATPEIAEEVHFMIRDWLGDIFSASFAESVRILYGGSVKPDNIGPLMAQKNIDGALVGGASLEAESFVKIARFRD